MNCFRYERNRETYTWLQAGISTVYVLWIYASINWEKRQIFSLGCLQWICGRIKSKVVDKSWQCFPLHHTVYHFVCMQFRLSNALENFSLLWVYFARKKINKFNLKEILIFSEKLQEHITHVQSKLMLFYEALLVQIIKNVRFSETIYYLVQVIRPARLEIADSVSGAVDKLKHLKNWTELSSFMDLCNVFWNFSQTEHVKMLEKPRNCKNELHQENWITGWNYCVAIEVL